MLGLHHTENSRYTDVGIAMHSTWTGSHMERMPVTVWLCLGGDSHLVCHSLETTEPDPRSGGQMVPPI